MRKQKHLFSTFFLLQLMLLMHTSGEVRLAWDASSVRSVTEGVYARMEQTADGNWLFGYSRGPAVYVRRSEDHLATFGEEIFVADNANYNDTNVEMLTLQNGWVLLAYNARPMDAYGGTLPYEIRVVVSKDNGLTWESDQVIYTAGKYFDTGCWEPVFLQYPDGEVQLFFANEYPYLDSNEQEISMLRSFDNGQTWEPELYTVSFREGFRDGMPVPVLLKSGTVAVAIEDNGIKGNFKPVILTSTPEERYTTGAILAEDPDRHYALAEESDVERRIYMGAPYLIQLSSGETLLSVQSSEARPYDHGNVSIPRVYVGDETAQHFRNGTTPFNFIPDYGNGNWNSLAQIDENRIALVSSVQGVESENGYISLWIAEAALNRPIQMLRFSPVVDGANTNGEWGGLPPVFLGAKFPDTQLRGNLQYDETHLYLYFDVSDLTLEDEESVFEPANTAPMPNQEINSDGVEFCVSFRVETPSNEDETGETDESGEAGEGTEPEETEIEFTRYKFQFAADNSLKSFKWGDDGWIPQEFPGIQYGITPNQTPEGATLGYRIEAGIPWTQLEGVPEQEQSMNVNITLHDDRHNDTGITRESISGCIEDDPASWLPCTLGRTPRVTYFQWQQMQRATYGLPADWPALVSGDFDQDGISNGSAFASGDCGDIPLSELIRPTLAENHWIFGFQRHLGALEVKSHCLLISLDDQPWMGLSQAQQMTDIQIDRSVAPCEGIERYIIQTSDQYTVKTALQTEFWSVQ